MKLKIFNFIITIMAIISVLIFIGAIGALDYSVEIGQEYSFINTIKLTILSVLFVLPAIVRDLLGR